LENTYDTVVAIIVVAFCQIVFDNLLLDDLLIFGSFKSIWIFLCYFEWQNKYKLFQM